MCDVQPAGTAKAAERLVWTISVRTREGLFTYEVAGDDEEIEALCQDIAWTHWQTAASQLALPSVAEFRSQHPELFACLSPYGRRVHGQRPVLPLG